MEIKIAEPTPDRNTPIEYAFHNLMVDLATLKELEPEVDFKLVETSLKELGSQLFGSWK